jgi:hypothetical protein
MTEAEWLNTTDLAALLRCEQVRGRTDRLRRKLRLFSCACARRLEPWFRSTHLLKALAASERYADGLLGDAGIGRWNLEASTIYQAAKESEVRDKASVVAAHRAVVYSCVADKHGGYQEIAWKVLQVDGAFGAQKAELLVSFLATLRDIFGNPFRPVTFSPSWRTDTAVSLARAMYESRDFGAMPILADALQDAGCDSDDILSHCRDASQVHVRGCWVCDLVLGKQ